MNQADRDLGAKLSEYRRRRSLLTRAFRASTRAGRRAYRSKKHGHTAADHFLKAASIVDQGAKEGIKVGGIVNQERLKSRSLLQLAQERSNIDRLTAPAKPAPVNTPAPTVAQVDKTKEDDQYIDHYAQNLALMNNV